MIDLVKMTRALGYDLNLQAEILENFIENASLELTTVIDSLGSQNFIPSFHRFRGFIANLYAPEFEILLNRIEDQIKEGQVLNKSDFNDMKSNYEHLIAEAIELKRDLFTKVGKP